MRSLVQAWAVLGRKAEQISEIRVQGQKDSIFPNREGEYRSSLARDMAASTTEKALYPAFGCS